MRGYKIKQAHFARTHAGYTRLTYIFRLDFFSLVFELQVDAQDDI